MYAPFASVCDDFYINMRLSTQLSLPHNRETVLHFFERVQRQFPEMSRFRKYDNGDLSIEENRDNDAYCWVPWNRPASTPDNAIPRPQQQARKCPQRHPIRLR